MAVEMVDNTHHFKGGNWPTLSARKCSEVLQLSKAVVFSAIDAEILWPQSKIQDDPDAKPAYGFHIDYIKEVLKVLPKKRLKTQRVFTPSVKAEINKINERWKKRYPTDEDGRFLVRWPLK